jgi:hypothetical protein
MICFSRVMTNRSSEILKISAGSALLAVHLGIGATRFAVDVAKHFRAPPVIQSLYPLLELAASGNGLVAFAVDIESAAQLVELRIQVNRKNVGDWNIVNMAHSPLGSVFSRDVVSQLLFRGRNLICSADADNPIALQIRDKLLRHRIRFCPDRRRGQCPQGSACALRRFAWDNRELRGIAIAAWRP